MNCTWSDGTVVSAHVGRIEEYEAVARAVTPKPSRDIARPSSTAIIIDVWMSETKAFLSRIDISPYISVTYITSKYKTEPVKCATNADTGNTRRRHESTRTASFLTQCESSGQAPQKKRCGCKTGASFPSMAAGHPDDHVACLVPAGETLLFLHSGGESRGHALQQDVGLSISSLLSDFGSLHNSHTKAT